ncbi:MAG: hypothetical protein LUF88_13585 [Bacteroides fragilis]|nr:hypothetical protein [Bacteroides fragilis]
MNNYINFDEIRLPRPIRDSIIIGFEKLKQYGVVSEVRSWMGAGITLSESGKKYFDNKSMAYEREDE